AEWKALSPLQKLIKQATLPYRFISVTAFLKTVTRINMFHWCWKKPDSGSLVNLIICFLACARVSLLLYPQVTAVN
ncbi:Hypothetical predicted protein, partial [Podarcis lilfordi]